MTEHRPHGRANECFAHVTQHVIAHAFRTRRVDVAVRRLQSAERVHGQTEQRGENANFHHHPEQRGCGRFAHGRVGVGAAGIKAHDAGGISDRFDTRKREHDADETAQFSKNPP